MSNKEQLARYAELVVCHGLNVQKNQIVNISSEMIHRDFAFQIAQAAYARGAKYVDIDLSEPRLTRLRIEKSEVEHLEYVPNSFSAKYNELLDARGANLKLIGSEDPELMSNLDTKRINTVRLKNHLAVKRFYDEGIAKSLLHWTVAAAATPKWGQKVFPELDPEQACKSLWAEIFRICRVDKEDCLALWQEHNTALQERAKRLDSLCIREIHFTGPGTDLRVYLSEKAIFKGGTDIGPHGVPFEPNLPTEEVFTTPHAGLTEGYVKATRPFLINGKLICELELKFEKGEITHFSASQGEETFREYIASDENANRLGEVAFVGIDSPVFQSGKVFQEILFDENAACHIAVGSAYKFCLRDGDTMSKEELAEIGCNESTVHTDMMISSEEVNVEVTTASGENVKIIQHGEWV